MAEPIFHSHRLSVSIEPKYMHFWTVRMQTNRVQDLINYRASNGDGRKGVRTYTWSEFETYLDDYGRETDARGEEIITLPGPRSLMNIRTVKILKVSTIKQQWFHILDAIGKETLWSAMGKNIPTYAELHEDHLIIARDIPEGYEYARKCEGNPNNIELLREKENGSLESTGTIIQINIDDQDWSIALKWGSNRVNGKAEATYPHPTMWRLGADKYAPNLLSQSVKKMTNSFLEKFRS